MAKISLKNIVLAIHEITKGKEGQAREEALAKIIKYLADKRLLSKAPEILRRLTALINQEEGVVTVRVKCKSAPAPKIIQDIENILKDRYQAKSIMTTIEEDKSLLGGIKIESQGEVIDLSYRNKINQLQNHLITN
jgi:ATP synthase F1 delta subunit